MTARNHFKRAGFKFYHDLNLLKCPHLHSRNRNLNLHRLYLCRQAFMYKAFQVVTRSAILHIDCLFAIIYSNRGQETANQRL